MADVTERMLRLLSALQPGGAFTGAELAARLGVSQRTLRRDIGRLRGYGYPVASLPGPGGTYRLGAGVRVPHLLLDEDEGVATVVALLVLAAESGGGSGDGLGDAARRAAFKLDDLLPDRLRPRAAALRDTVETAVRDPAPVKAARIGALATAIVAGERVEFDYTDADGRGSRRDVEPAKHVHVNDHWYLLAWDLDRQAWRVFRTDRISALHRNGRPGSRRDIPAATALEFLRSGLTEDPGR